jgi:hypothetical protein
LKHTTQHILQGMTEFAIQGRHFAASQERGHLADDEVLDPHGMYAAACKPTSIADIVTMVGFRMLDCTYSIALSRHALPV